MDVKDLCVCLRTYTTKEGVEKKVWQKIGALHTQDDGKQYVTLEPWVNLSGLPIREGYDKVFVAAFERDAERQREQLAVAADADVQPELRAGAQRERGRGDAQRSQRAQSDQHDPEPGHRPGAPDRPRDAGTGDHRTRA